MSKRDIVDPTAVDPLNGPLLYRVILQADLEETGSVSGKVTVPVKPADPDDPDNEDSDWWRETEQVISKIRNGLPNSTTIPEGNAVWIHNYFGRWVVLVPEC